jgi:hypothetical protein
MGSRSSIVRLGFRVTGLARQDIHQQSAISNSVNGTYTQTFFTASAKESLLCNYILRIIARTTDVEALYLLGYNAV